MRTATIGVTATFVLAAVTLTIGGINENDVHRLNQSVANSFFAPDPGKLYEVTEDSATPLCSFADAQDAIVRDEPAMKHYTNHLGRNIPVASLLSSVLPQLNMTQQVELKWGAFAEGLQAGYEFDVDETCEQKAQAAYERNSVVCIVDNVFRSIDGEVVRAVRFKNFAFTPENAAGYPLCPLRTPKDPLWAIRRHLISVAVVTDTAEAMSH